MAANCEARGRFQVLVFLGVTPSCGINFERRTATSGPSARMAGAGSAPSWVKIERSGTLLSGHAHYNSRGDLVAKTDAAGSLAYEACGERPAEAGRSADRQRASR